MALHHEGLADLDARAVADRHQVERLADVQADGFFAEDVLAGFGGARGHGHVQVVRQRIVDGIDLRVRQHLLIGSVCFWNAQFRRRLVRFGAVARGDAHDLAQLSCLHRPGSRGSPQCWPLLRCPIVLFS